MYVILWEFAVRPDKIRDFVAAYKADGEWARLFSLAEGYVGTELLSSDEAPERYVTIDRWRSANNFVRFQTQFGDQYRRLDQRLELLTLSERKLGSFTSVE
jgi:heme-degrading monooxygenase HmoA